MASVSPSTTTTFTVVEPTSTPIHRRSYDFCGFAFSVSPAIFPFFSILLLVRRLQFGVRPRLCGGGVPMQVNA
jgi:hypothetical protein